MGRRLVTMTAVAALIILIDRASKLYVLEGLKLETGGPPFDVFPPYLRFVMTWNQGVNFGLLNFGEAGRWVLVALALAISCALVVWAARSCARIVPTATGLVVGGALGNVWDRIQWGAVADFLNMSCCGINNPFAFNIADAAIAAGAILLILFVPSGKPGGR